MMKKTGIILIASILLIISGLSSCFRIENIAKEPKIRFEEFILKDSVGFNHLLNGTLRFYFEDGDGNIGFGVDSIAENTVFIEKYEIVNNQAIKIEIDGSLINFKIKEFSTSGNRRALKGDIVIKNLDELINDEYTITYKYDTIMYKFFIQDRDHNVSNTDSTGYIALKNYLK
jgi:hypothetical protein